jgi:hypothetical protein
MSSPTISVPGNTGDTSLLTIMNLVRALVNDSQAGATGTPGEGQVFTDNPAISPFTQPFLNSSIRELYRELRNVGQPTLLKDNVIVSGLTPVNSVANGLGGPNPAVQVYLGFGGYFDGLSINADLKLPGDMIYPERVWERQTGSNDIFVPMTQPTFGLPSVYQASRLSMWEWRNDNIWMLGSIQTNDVRLRYWATLPQFFSQTLDFASTFVPIIDCTDAVAYKTAVKYATMLGSPGLPDLKMDAKEQMFQLKNGITRRQQSQTFMGIPYGSYNSGYNYSGSGYNVFWQ